MPFLGASEGTEFSLLLSQNTLLAVGANIAGWTVLKEPNVAFFIDAEVAGYDYGHLGMIPSVPTIPAYINSGLAGWSKL